MLLASISKNSLLLGAFALISAAILATTQFNTKDRIAEAERKAAIKALQQIIPKSRYNNDLLTDTISVPQEYWSDLGLRSGGDVHIARSDGTPVAVIIPTLTSEGYSGDIKMIVGINADGTTAGVRVLKHSETPGLGDKIEIVKSKWILGFNGKSLINPSQDNWKVKKDKGEFDQFTGATITPRAVVQQVLKTLQFQEKMKVTLFSQLDKGSRDTSNVKSFDTDNQSKE